MVEHEGWQSPPSNLSLTPDEVHVWRVALEAPAEEVVQLERLLADEERERAARFRFERDRRRWVVAHAFLRMVLGRYLEVDPSALHFTTNEYGKPSLISPPWGTTLHLNLSHSGDLALCAFARGRQVGIDVEYMRADLNYRELAASHFSARERAAFDALPAALQDEAFFLCWTRKEAYLKARGRGLALALDSFDVSLAPGEPAVLLCSREEPGAAGRWVLRALAPGRSYAAALAVEGSGWQLRCWQCWAVAHNGGVDIPAARVPLDVEAGVGRETCPVIVTWVNKGPEASYLGIPTWRSAR